MSGPITDELKDLDKKLGVYTITRVPPRYPDWPMYDRWLDRKKEIEAAINELFLAGMSTTRDPRIDPQVGDKIYKISATGHKSTRQVVSRDGPGNNDIWYLTQDGKKKKCWIATWMEWARTAEVEPA